MNKTNFLVNPKEQFNKSMSLDYDSIVEKPVIIKNGEFSIIPFIKISAANSRLHRFSKELDVEITVNLYKGPNYQKVDNLDYKFTLMLGNETGFPVIDSFYKVPMDKFLNYLRLSVSKFHLRILDQLKCMPLETEIAYTNQQLVAPLGTNQGLNNGTIGIVSNSNPNNSMKDWLVVSVIDSNPDYSILEMLNPNREMSDLDGKIINLCEKVLRTLPHYCFYARIDLVINKGHPVLMEIEVIEPSLYFNLKPQSSDLFAKKVSDFFNHQYSR